MTKGKKNWFFSQNIKAKLMKSVFVVFFDMLVAIKKSKITHVNDINFKTEKAFFITGRNDTNQMIFSEILSYV